MTPQKITYVCPNCRRAYNVSVKAAGHRARCLICGKTFRLAESILPPPTEDDIVNWLREPEDKDEAAAERIQETEDELAACLPAR